MRGGLEETRVTSMKRMLLSAASGLFLPVHQTSHRRTMSDGHVPRPWKPETMLQRTIIVAWLLVLLAAAAHAAEPSLSVTIEEKSQFVHREQLYIGQITLAVALRIDSDQTADVEVECVFRVPRRGIKTTHIWQGHVRAGQPVYGSLRQWVPTGFVGYSGDDWEVVCEARPHR